MRETQQTISEWAEATFGPAGSDLRVAARANEELAELVRLLSFGGDPAKVAEEAADTLIVLCRLAERKEQQLQFWAGKPWGNYDFEAMAGELAEAMAGVLRASVRFTRVPLQDLVDYLIRVIIETGRVPQVEIDRKMRINRARQWRLDGTGHGYHVAAETREAALRAALSAAENLVLGELDRHSGGYAGGAVEALHELQAILAGALAPSQEASR